MHEMQDQAGGPKPHTGDIKEWKAGNARNLLGVRHEGVSVRERLRASAELAGFPSIKAKAAGHTPAACNTTNCQFWPFSKFEMDAKL